jgi:GNAT superfamily N-acetyltransferase
MMTYRNAKSSDAAMLDRLFDTVFCDTFAHLYRPEDLETFLSSFGVGEWEAQLDDPAFAFQIAEADGEPAGYVKLGPLKLPIEPRGPPILLDQLYILKEHHGTGIARALMDWAIDEARHRGAEELYLTVYIDNHRARRFYYRYGFEDVGRYAFMVGEQADEDVIMRKRL